jgi:hypothetical protein
MTPREWSLVKRLAVIVILTALFPVGALAFRFLFGTDALAQALPGASPAVFTLVPAPPGQAAAATPSSAAFLIVVPNGWKQYSVNEQNFAIALPPKWQQLPVNPQELDASLKTIRISNPELAAALGERAPQLMRNGVKFWAFDLDPDSLKGNFATNVTLTRQSLSNEVSLDAYVLVNVNQLEQLSTRQGPVSHQSLTLGNLPAEKVRYNLLFQGSDGGTTISAITQYLLLNHTEAYVLTFATRLDQFDRYASTFDKSAATFRLLSP